MEVIVSEMNSRKRCSKNDSTLEVLAIDGRTVEEADEVETSGAQNEKLLTRHSALCLPQENKFNSKHGDIGRSTLLFDSKTISPFKDSKHKVFCTSTVNEQKDEEDIKPLTLK